MTKCLQTKNAVHINPYNKQTVCCKEIEGACLYLKENIFCHLFHYHSSQVSRALCLGCPKSFLNESDSEMVVAVLDALIFVSILTIAERKERKTCDINWKLKRTFILT